VEGWNLLDSLYFSVITLTTIGYGDLSPSTVASKIFTIFYVFVGIGIILAFVNAVAERAMERRSKAKDKPEDAIEANSEDATESGSRERDRCPFLDRSHINAVLSWLGALTKASDHGGPPGP
jgi:voltage-gated potassium channel Kch